MSSANDGTLPGPYSGNSIVPEAGYRIESFLEPSEIQTLLELHQATASSAPTDHYNTARVATIETKHRIFDEVRALVEDKVQKVVPGYRMYMASFVTKKADGTQGRLPMHPDPSVVNHQEHIGVNLWIPLCDVNEQNGCLRVMEYSPGFGHIAAVPPKNPSPFDALRKELEANYLKPVPMSAGQVFVFDTRVLHATEANRTSKERVALFINLTPEGVAPRHYFWTPESPGKLEVYDVDTEFVMALDGATYPDEEQRAKGKFIGTIDYAPVPWTMDDVKARLPKVLKQSPAIPPVVPQPKASTDVPIPPARAGFWDRFPKFFSSGRQN